MLDTIKKKKKFYGHIRPLLHNHFSVQYTLQLPFISVKQNILSCALLFTVIFNFSNEVMVDNLLLWFNSSSQYLRDGLLTPKPLVTLSITYLYSFLNVDCKLFILVNTSFLLADGSYSLYFINYFLYYTAIMYLSCSRHRKLLWNSSQIYEWLTLCMNKETRN